MKVMKTTWTTHGGTVVRKIVGGRSNVFTVSTGRNTLLVDTGPRWYAPLLYQRLRAHQAGHDLRALLLTHAHYDHVENAARLQTRHSLDVLAHQADARHLAVGSNPFPHGTNTATRAVTDVFGELYMLFCIYAPVQPTVALSERTCLMERYGINAYALHTPGHTPGSVSVIVDDEIAIVGDVMQGVFPHSIYPPFGQDAEDTVHSWKKLLDTGCRLFLPAHGWENTRAFVEQQYAQRVAGFTTLSRD